MNNLLGYCPNCLWDLHELKTKHKDSKAIDLQLNMSDPILKYFSMFMFASLKAYYMTISLKITNSGFAVLEEWNIYAFFRNICGVTSVLKSANSFNCRISRVIDS